jgi:hypothetical protein
VQRERGDPYNMTFHCLQSIQIKVLPAQLSTKLPSLNSFAVGSTSGEMAGYAAFSTST